MKTTLTANRRKFLLTAGLGGAGVAAAVVTAGKALPPATEAPSPAKPTGYHASAHILKYYKTTEV